MAPSLIRLRALSQRPLLVTTARTACAVAWASRRAAWRPCRTELPRAAAWMRAAAGPAGLAGLTAGGGFGRSAGFRTWNSLSVLASEVCSNDVL